MQRSSLLQYNWFLTHGKWKHSFWRLFEFGLASSSAFDCRPYCDDDTQRAWTDQEMWSSFALDVFAVQLSRTGQSELRALWTVVIWPTWMTLEPPLSLPWTGSWYLCMPFTIRHGLLYMAGSCFWPSFPREGRGWYSCPTQITINVFPDSTPALLELMMRSRSTSKRTLRTEGAQCSLDDFYLAYLNALGVLLVIALDWLLRLTQATYFPAWSAVHGWSLLSGRPSLGRDGKDTAAQRRLQRTSLLTIPLRCLSWWCVQEVLLRGLWDSLVACWIASVFILCMLFSQSVSLVHLSSFEFVYRFHVGPFCRIFSLFRSGVVFFWLPLRHSGSGCFLLGLAPFLVCLVLRWSAFGRNANLAGGFAGRRRFGCCCFLFLVVSAFCGILLVHGHRVMYWLSFYRFYFCQDRALRDIGHTRGKKKIHSARNSIIFASRSGRNLSTSVSVGPTPGAGILRGNPSVFLAYMSAKYNRHILATHCAGFSMSMATFAIGHVSGIAVRQCRSSEVSAGEILVVFLQWGGRLFRVFVFTRYVSLSFHHLFFTRPAYRCGRCALVPVMPARPHNAISGILAGRIPGFGIVTFLLWHPTAHPCDVFGLSLSIFNGWPAR